MLPLGPADQTVRPPLILTAESGEPVQERISGVSLTMGVPSVCLACEGLTLSFRRAGIHESLSGQIAVIRDRVAQAHVRPAGPGSLITAIVGGEIRSGGETGRAPGQEAAAGHPF